MGLQVTGENLALVGGLLGGLVFDLAYGNILLMIEDQEGQHKNYIIYKSKKFIQ